MDILGGHDKIGLVLGVSSLFLGSFLKVNVQNENIFAWQKFKIFFGVLDIPDFFAANGRCWAQSCVRRKGESTPPHHTHSPWVTVYDEKLLAR